MSDMKSVNDIMGSFAQRLRDAMQSAGLKAVDLHERTGISKASISEYLSGNYEPKQKNVYRLAEALHVAPSYLMGLSEQETPAPAAAPPPGLTARDERDIERRLDAIMNDLAPGTGLAFYDGQKLTDSERDLLRISLKNSMELVRSMAKERFTPKKYKK